MNLVDVVSVVCVGVGTITSLPQFVRLLRHRNSAGLSVLAWQIWTAVGVGWTVHGIVENSAVLIIPNAAGFLVALGVLLLIRADRRIPLVSLVWLAVLISVVAIGLRLGFGPQAYAWFMVIPQAIAVLGQFIDLVRWESIVGISPIYLWIAMLLQVFWLIWGILVVDRAVIISCIVMLVTTNMNLLWFYLRKMRVVAARPQFPTTAWSR